MMLLLFVHVGQSSASCDSNPPSEVAAVYPLNCSCHDSVLVLQLTVMALSKNRLFGTLPSNWVGLTKASHAM